uniref:NADH dehydrogenase subunit 6 n=1 Tax=Allonothrus sinicus TaxID=3138099 RepID=UPI00315DD9A5
MAMLAAATVMMASTTTSPISLSVMILTVSIMLTTPIYKSTGSGWIPFILIITFSSGMMTLFMYTASLANNEVNKSKKKTLTTAILLTPLMIPHTHQNKTQSSMKVFSKQSMMMMMMMMLIITMMALASHGHSPHQTLNSSF